MIQLYVMYPSSMYHDINDTHVLCLLQACIMIHLCAMPPLSMYHDTPLCYAFLQHVSWYTCSMYHDIPQCYAFCEHVSWYIFVLCLPPAHSNSCNVCFWGRRLRQLFDIAATVFIAYLSMPIIQNLWSNQQEMNRSYEPLRIVNTYGAFGR